MPLRRSVNLQHDEGGIENAKSLRSGCVSLNPYPEKLAAYFKLAAAAVTPFGARILARGNAAGVREQGLKERTVIIEYPSLEMATAAYSSPAYAEAFKALGEVVRDFTAENYCRL